MANTKHEIADWLADRGMAEYAGTFADNRIDFGVLPYLTDCDLKDLGVRLGDRRKLLAWATGLKSTSPPELENNLTSTPGASSEQSSPERRQVTVLFCDLVGSTALSTRIDPEDLREVMQAYQSVVAECVRRFEGFVAGYRGDGVLAYFGYPQAHEDDAERAVQAGLDLVAAVTALPSAVPLETRVGIATGMVVVGDLLGSGDTLERNIVGETPNLASRLLAIAEPDTVVIADRTRELLGDLFEVTDLGRKDIKGLAAPVRAWTVLQPRAVESRYDALHMAGLTALTGRDEELDILLKRWKKAKSGEGQVVLLSGEPGIGKSRLTAALMESIAREPHTRIRYFCSPQHTDSALYPIIGHFERAAALLHDDKPQTKLDKLDKVFERTSASIEDRALIADMLSLPNDGRYPPVVQDAERRRTQTQDALIGRLAELGVQQPALMVFEDAHWIDPTSLDLIGQTVARIKSLPVLLILTFRPEFNAPWAGQSQVTSLMLSRLGERDTATVIFRVAGNRTLPADVISEIVERTDGIPLFVEEMTKAVLEAEGEGEALRPVAVLPSPVFGIPPSLHASLTARLDRLGPARSVAQIGAAIGRSFSHELLAAVAREHAHDLIQALERLIESGLLFRQGQPPHATYLFKHALVQDAAYGMFLREPRRALHARILEALENQFGDTAEKQPQLLAHHATEAGLIEKAAVLWGTAGQSSLERSALAEAMAQLSRALSLISELPSTPALRSREIDFQVAHAQAVMHGKGYTLPETRASFQRVRELISRAKALGEPLSDPLHEFVSLYGQWVTRFVSFDHLVLPLAETFLTLAEAQNAKIPLLIGHRMMGSTLMYAGNIKLAKAHFDEVIELSGAVENRSAALRFGHEPRITALSYSSVALCSLGFPDSADRDAALALELARNLGHATTLLLALGYRVKNLLSLGQLTTAAGHIEELLKLSNEKGAPYWIHAATLYQGLLFHHAGQDAQAVATITAALSAGRESGALVMDPFFMSHLANAHAHRGEFDAAHACIAEALSSAEARQEMWSNSDIHRVAGEIEVLSSGPKSSAAEGHFQRAIAIARSQSTKMFELRAATSLARLWRDQGKRREAYDLLAPVFNWFTEGFDTRDLKDAKALLDAFACDGN